MKRLKIGQVMRCVATRVSGKVTVIGSRLVILEVNGNLYTVNRKTLI